MEDGEARGPSWCFDVFFAFDGHSVAKVIILVKTPVSLIN